MADESLIRFRKIRKADDLDDTLDASEILGSPVSAVTEQDLQVAFLAQIRRIIFGDDYSKHWNDDFISQGIPSLVQLVGGTPESVGKVHFTYATPSPLVIQALSPGNVIDRSVLLITTPFDDSGAALQLGTAANPGLIFDVGESVPTDAGQYDNMAVNEFSIPELLRLTITPAASTQGEGLLLYKIRS